MTVTPDEDLIAVPQLIPAQFHGPDRSRDRDRYLAAALEDLGPLPGALRSAGLDQAGLTIAPIWAGNERWASTGRSGGFYFHDPVAGQQLGEQAAKLTRARDMILAAAEASGTLMQAADALVIYGQAGITLFGPPTVRPFSNVP